MLILKNIKIFSGIEKAYKSDILISDNMISDISENIITDKNSKFLNCNKLFACSPLCDLQVNGGGGVLFNNKISLDAVEKIHKAHIKKGSFNLLITLITDREKNIFKAIEIIREYKKRTNYFVGLHLEGSYISIEKKGIHNEKYIKKLSNSTLNMIIKYGAGVINLITIAPEAVSIKQVKKLIENNIKVALGHTNASAKICKNYYDLGADIVTHLFNAMSPFHSREPGLIGLSLSNDSYAGIIADGIHVDYTSIKAALNAKKGKLFLVSDSMPFTGSDLEEFSIGDKNIYKINNTCLDKSGTLAGANLSLSQAMKNIYKNVDSDIASVVKMGTFIPYSIIKKLELSLIKKGQKADLIIFDSEFNLKYIIENGNIKRAD